jgi:integrase
LRIAQYIEILINSPKWQSVDSILTRLHQLTAALSIHCPTLSKDPLLFRISSSLSKLKTFDAPQQAFPAPLDYVLRLIHMFFLMKEPQMAALIALMWTCALRLADALRLRKDAVSLTTNPPFIQMKWHKNQRSADGVKVLLQSSPMMTPIRVYAASIPPAQPLFFSIPKRRVAYLLTTHTTITGHSIRRGALQTMAKAGVPEQAIRQLSGHRSYALLLKYLRMPPQDVQKSMLDAQRAALS